MRTRVSKPAAAARLMLALAICHAPAAAQDRTHPRARYNGAPKDTVAAIPSSVRAEHEELLRELAAVSAMPGAVGRAGRDLAATLQPHFAREEQIALPPLGLLRTLADGKVTPAMGRVVPMADSLKAELPQMLVEHATIAMAVERLRLAARAAKVPAAERFAMKLRMHARQEEEVLYPAAVLVGEYLKLRLPTPVGALP